MEINQKIRLLREINQWTQEEVAEKMNMAINSYARLERGESPITLQRLEKLADIYNISIEDLINKEQSFIRLSISNSYNFQNNYNNSELLQAEIERLNLIIQHKDEVIKMLNHLLEQKDRVLESLQLALENIKNSNT